MSGKLRFDAGYLAGAVSEKDLESMAHEAAKANRLLMDGTGPGGEFLGWVNLPAEWTEEGLREIEEAAIELKSISDAVVVVGIGGSYLGARAGIEFLTPGAVGRDIFFAGQNMSGDYLADLLDCLIDREVAVVVISKSGTTTEPAIAFRLLEDFLKKKYGQGKIKKRVVCITDREKGALRSLARMEEYRTFSIPDNIGGRFSALTTVGLFPMACAGIAVSEIVSGARDQMAHSAGSDVENNVSCYYAAIRNILYGKGKKIEMLSNFDPELHYMGEWWKQLFGESEGKKGRGIFPASCDLSTDLHSMGQLMQEGERNIFETFLIVDSGTKRCVVPKSREDIDGLNYLAGFDVDHVNNKAYIATAEAHFEGGVPNMTVGIPDKSAFSLGQLYYFFERAVAISGYIAGVNPFDQPGVESYKKKMFKLLGKPGA